MENDRAGVSTAYGILFFGFGDASIEAAMKENDLTDIHHVDYETMNILYLFARYQTIVYGR